VGRLEKSSGAFAFFLNFLLYFFFQEKKWKEENIKTSAIPMDLAAHADRLRRP
jgi:hypothetical protein